jgi:hypothetical protein
VPTTNPPAASWRRVSAVCNLCPDPLKIGRGGSCASIRIVKWRTKRPVSAFLLRELGDQRLALPWPRGAVRTSAARRIAFRRNRLSAGGRRRAASHVLAYAGQACASGGACPAPDPAGSPSYAKPRQPLPKRNRCPAAKGRTNPRGCVGLANPEPSPLAATPGGVSVRDPMSIGHRVESVDEIGRDLRGRPPSLLVGEDVISKAWRANAKLWKTLVRGRLCTISRRFPSPSASMHSASPPADLLSSPTRGEEKDPQSATSSPADPFSYCGNPSVIS